MRLVVIFTAGPVRHMTVRAGPRTGETTDKHGQRPCGSPGLGPSRRLTRARGYHPAQDGPRGEVPAGWRVLFRAAFLRTARAPFSARGSLVTYAVLLAGCPWMASWQVRQTVRVLRRICVIFAD